MLGKGPSSSEGPLREMRPLRWKWRRLGNGANLHQVQGTGYLTMRRKRNACPRCEGSGQEPEEELSLMDLRKRRRKGLPPLRRGRARPLCTLCQGTGVADWLDTRAATAGSRASEAAKRASPELEGAESGATEEQAPAEPTPISGDPLPLEERVLGYIVG